jgi:hypothetical protein
MSVDRFGETMFADAAWGPRLRGDAGAASGLPLEFGRSGGWSEAPRTRSHLELGR